MATATSHLVDVSAYQGPQDWAAWRARGVVGAFAKASEGQRSRDGRFDAHIAGILKAGLVPGGYHFAWPVQDVAAEAANYIGAVRPYARRGFCHWLDLERYNDGRNYGNRTAAQIRAWVVRWLATVATAFPGQRVGVYTSGSDIAAGHVPAGVTLWYPAYPGARVDTYAEAEAATRPRPGGRSPLIWQFTSDPEGPPHIDESIAYLSPAAFRAWAAGSAKEDDMQLSDKVAIRGWLKKAWPKDKGLQDGSISVETALASGYGHSRRAAENTTVLVAQMAALSAAVQALARDGGLPLAKVQAAAEAGARAALAELGTKLQEG